MESLAAKATVDILSIMTTARTVARSRLLVFNIKIPPCV